MCIKQSPQYLRDAQAARRKAEIEAGIRSDRRFVGKVVPSKRRKKQEKQQRRDDARREEG